MNGKQTEWSDRIDEMNKIHETVLVADGASIGTGTTIWQNCIIQDEVVIGNKCNIGANVFIERGVRIGDRVKIKNNIAIYSGVIVEDDVFLGPNCVFTNVIHPRSFIDRKKEFQNTYVKSGATVGANVTIICGHTIGQYAMIGAGAIVTKDVPEHALVVGNPGKVVGYVCECGCKLDKRFECKQCRKKYEEKDLRRAFNI